LCRDHLDFVLQVFARLLPHILDSSRKSWKLFHAYRHHSVVPCLSASQLRGVCSCAPLCFCTSSGPVISWSGRSGELAGSVVFRATACIGHSHRCSNVGCSLTDLMRPRRDHLTSIPNIVAANVQTEVILDGGLYCIPGSALTGPRIVTHATG
jgi:hypothetical protein